MHIIFSMIFVAFLSYAGWTFYDGYRQSKETGRKRWIDTAEGSATILWQKAVMVFGALTGLLVEVADYFNEPTIADKIHTYLTPQVWSAITLGIAVVTIWARKRTL